MDIKAKPEELVEKLQEDKALQESFQKAPISAVEKLIGIDLPDDRIEALADAVKARLDLDRLGGALGGLGSLFGKR